MIPTRVSFYERTVIHPGAEKPYRYKLRTHRSTYDGSGHLTLDHPPAVGDLVWLPGQEEGQGGGSYRVLTRQWMYTSYGSVNWPYGKPEPGDHSCDIIVEKVGGVFADEAELTDEEREEE